MQIGTMRTSTGTQVFVQNSSFVTAIDGYADVGALLRDPFWKDIISKVSTSKQHVGSLELVSPILNPGKIICVGANYREHIREMDSGFPELRTLFAKVPEALSGPHDDIQLPGQEQQVD